MFDCVKFEYMYMENGCVWYSIALACWQFVHSIPKKMMENRGKAKWYQILVATFVRNHLECITVRSESICAHVNLYQWPKDCTFFLSFQKRQYRFLWNLLITESMVFRLPLMYHSKWNIDTTSSIIQIICIPLALYLNIITKPSTFNAIRILLRYYSVDIRTILHWLSQFVLCKRCECALFVLTANNIN